MRPGNGIEIRVTRRLLQPRRFGIRNRNIAIATAFAFGYGDRDVARAIGDNRTDIIIKMKCPASLRL